ncbi:MAG: carbon-nitrogen hydrolase family protein [Dehalococcoidia bacterium]|nr:MAG: carbon-nitrogen hydrolase family protein [Dehalococcoidia bacterium]
MPRPFRIAALQPRTFEPREHVRAWEALLARIDESIAGHHLLVLPEAAIPGWALLSRDAAAALNLPADEVWFQALADRARRSGCAIAAGIVRRDSDGALRNELVLFGRDGSTLAHAGERTASGWFARGRGPAVADIEGVRVGLIVGHDLARRDLMRGLAGVQLLIAAAAPRDTGRVPTFEASAESDLLAARVALLGAWGIVGGKSGSEGGLVRFCGGAGILDPAGQWVVRAPADQPGIAATEIDIDAAPGSALDFASLPAMRAEDTGRDAATGHAAAIAFDPHPSAVESMERVRALVGAAVASGARLVVLPDLAGTDPRAVTAAETLPFLRAVTEGSGITLFAGLAERSEGQTFKTAYAIEDGQVLFEHRQSVLDRDERAAGFRAGDRAPQIVRTALGAVGLLSGAEGLALGTPAGAGIAVWCAGDAAAPVGGTARAIAIEDGVTVVAAGSTSRAGGAFVVDATGRVLAATPPGDALVASARLL